MVADYLGQPIKKAEVQLSSGKKSVILQYDTYSEEYITTDFIPARYSIHISAEGMESQSRNMFIGKSGTYETFILGKKGMPYFYRGVVKVPFEPMDHIFGVVLEIPEDEKAIAMLNAFAGKQKVILQPADENYQKNGLYIFSFPDDSTIDKKEKIIATFRSQKGILTAGPMLKLKEKAASLLTDEIIVRFKGNIEEKEVQEISRKLGLSIVRTISYAGNAYQFRVNQQGLYKSLEICRNLADTEVIDYAEPNLYHTVQYDAITPPNFLFPEQWDHPLINTPDAWQVLNDRLGPTQRFGNPDIIIGIMDKGIQISHPQFNGTVSNRQPKMFATFDFEGMVPHHNSLNDQHGTCCASAAAGYTHSSSANGLPDGTVGVAGNCRLIGAKMGGGTEASFSDIYIWTGGFNPNSHRSGFPATLSRGADIISSSFGFSEGMPISGLMRDTFDFLTTYGRNGKGIILTFSSGNYTANQNFHLQRPWAAYEKTLACGASTLDSGQREVITRYSGSGYMLDFCAPSSTDTRNGYKPPQVYAAFTANLLHSHPNSLGNLPRNKEKQTQLIRNANAGERMILVGSTIGIRVGQAIFIGSPSTNISHSEAKTVTVINHAFKTIGFTPELFTGKPSGTVVLCGDRDYTSNFGGTSYATPVIAGIAALMLSVNQRLTWVEVREILRETATKIDPHNRTDVGKWYDVFGRPSTSSLYTTPFFSQFYGFGRVNAALAVSQAASYNHTRDILIRDNMMDTGISTSSPPFSTGVDIWVRNTNDGVVPASYNTDANNIHQPPVYNQTNWLYVRFRNRGTDRSYPFYVRTYITHYPGTAFIYPENFIPTINPNTTFSGPLRPGTYLIGEQRVAPLNAGTDDTLTFEWPAHLVPRRRSVISGITVYWSPSILVEVSPHDGFVPTGKHIWDNNNLAQKNISIITPVVSPDYTGVISVNTYTKSTFKKIQLTIIPDEAHYIPYFIHFSDPELNEVFIKYAKTNIPGASFSYYQDAQVTWFHAPDKIYIEIPDMGHTTMLIGLGKLKSLTKDVKIDILQYDNKTVTGHYSFEFRDK